ncbi:MAG: hypothetical protein ACREPS_02780 [Rhodanobacteraceae bacterium]
MRWILMLQRKVMLAGLLGTAVLGTGISMMVQAAPVGEPGVSAIGIHDRKQMQAQLKEVDAKVSTARAHNTELQAQVTRLEQQNADRRKQLQQRDDEIAALQEKLQAAGGPGSASSTGH